VEAWRVGGEDAEVPGEASRLVGVFAPAELEVADHDPFVVEAEHELHRGLEQDRRLRA
jgi:hypothetical protein